jgi:predicted nucleic acid-binding protein
MPILSKKVYIAPDVFFAFIDRTHAKHEQAAAFFRYFAQENYHIFTDTISLYDAYTHIASEMSPSVSRDFLRTIYISNITIMYPDESDMKSALKLYLNDKAGEFTFQKALMSVLADRRGVSHLATFEYIRTMFGLTIFYIPI